MANWLYILRNINKKWEILHTHTHIYIEKMHKDIDEGETN